MTLLTPLLSLSRFAKRLVFFAHDVILIFMAFWLSVGLRVGVLNEWGEASNWTLLAILIVLSLAGFNQLGLYRTVIRYAGLRIIQTVLLGSLLSVLIMLIASFFLHINLPRSIPVNYFVLVSMLMIGSRFTVKGVLQSEQKNRNRPVLIYGAGASGRQLLAATMKVGDFLPVAFVDDDEQMQQTEIQNRVVYSSEDIPYLIERYGVETILLAIPNASPQQKRAVMSRLSKIPCQILSVPSIKALNLLGEAAGIRVLEKVSAIDLLGREAIEPIEPLMAKSIAGKVVMVTGAGGSIGSELCRQVIQKEPVTLVLFDISEYSLYKIEQELASYVDNQRLNVTLKPVLGTVQKGSRLSELMKRFGVQTIYHAAAYKHVPLVEFNTIEGIRNNVFGTLYCALAAVEASVETFVLISTDKAVRPTSTMGATKRMAELILQALAIQPEQKTNFSMVRFGNVLGSSGSVIPLFERQIAQGGPVTVTHAEVTRYFMTISEAAQLVIQASAMAKGGDVFVLDMGQSVKIIDLAKQMINLSGLTVKDELNPDGDIEIVMTGLRPGEKLFEELLIGTNVSGSAHPRIMTTQESMLEWDALQNILNALDKACYLSDFQAARALLLEAPIGFQPDSLISEK